MAQGDFFLVRLIYRSIIVHHKECILQRATGPVGALGQGALLASLPPGRRQQQADERSLRVLRVHRVERLVAQADLLRPRQQVARTQPL